VTQNTSGDLIAPFTIKAKDANGALSSTVVTVKVGVDDLNMAPTITGTPTALTYTENGAAAVITSLLTVTDPDGGTSATIIGAEVSIQTEGEMGTYLEEDVLSFVDTTKLYGDFDPFTGILTISLKEGVSGVTAAEMTTALKTVKYTNLSDNPDTTNRAVSFTVADNGMDNSLSDTKSTTIIVKAVNDAPIYDRTVATMVLGQGSTLIVTMEEFLAGSAADGYSFPQDSIMSDSDANAKQGIAITSVNSTAGTFYYSTDGGDTWQSVGTVSKSSALHLAANGDGQTLFKVVLNPDFTGSLTNVLTHYAWDQSNNIVNGAKAALPTTTGGSTAYSALPEVGNLVVPSYEDADIVITHGELVPQLQDITAFPVGTYEMGGVTITFTSTAGTIKEGGLTLGTITIVNGAATFTVDGVKYSYKLIAADDNSLILGQTNSDVTLEMNMQYLDGPGPVLTMFKSTAAPLTMPTNGMMTLYTTEAEAFGDYNEFVKADFNFDTGTMSAYDINGNVRDIQFSVVDNVLVGSDESGTFEIKLMGYSTANGVDYFVFDQIGTDTWNWGPDSAVGYTTITAYLTANGSYLFNDEYYSARYASGKYYFTDKMTGETDIHTATLTANALTIYYVDSIEVYSVENGMIVVTDTYEDIFSLSNSPVYEYDFIANPVYDFIAPDAPTYSVNDTTDTVYITNLENGATWQYSLDGGVNWIFGTGNSLTLPGTGTYEILFQQIDMGNNYSNTTYANITLTDNPSAGSVTITSSTLVAPESDITAFPNGASYTDGFATITFTSDTSGTVSTLDGGLYALSIVNNAATVTVEGITYSYKMLGSDGDVLVLGQTDLDLTSEMNGETQGPPPIWSLISTTATADTFPTSGTITFWATETDNFGDQNGVTWPKMVIDFDNHTIQNYFIDGTTDTLRTFSIDTNTDTMHIDQTATNAHASDMQLMGNANGFFVFEDNYTESYTWDQGSAQGASDMDAYLTAQNDILWSENGYDYNGNGTAYDYGLVTRTNGTVTGFTQFISNQSDNSDQSVDYTALSATLNNGILVIDEGDRTETYSIADNGTSTTTDDMIQIVATGIEIITLATSNPFDVTYA